VGVSVPTLGSPDLQGQSSQTLWFIDTILKTWEASEADGLLTPRDGATSQQVLPAQPSFQSNNTEV
jgi:hypothetical protein